MRNRSFHLSQNWENYSASRKLTELFRHVLLEGFVNTSVLCHE